MKVLQKAFVVFTVLFLPIALACKCMQPSAKGALYGDVDSVFLGRVVKQLVSNDENNLKYLINVGRVFKGCFITSDSFIILSTGTSSASCGLQLALKTRYIFSGILEPVDPTMLLQVEGRTIAGEVSAGTCGYNSPWLTVSPEDKLLLRDYENVCKDICSTGADCPVTSYCDAGKCVAFDAPCPDGVPLGVCPGPPCKYATPCAEAGLDAQCIENFCGGCYAIFVNAARNRVCV
jgi:hypothetical protein